MQDYILKQKEIIWVKGQVEKTQCTPGHIGLLKYISSAFLSVTGNISTESKKLTNLVKYSIKDEKKNAQKYKEKQKQKKMKT